MKLTLLTCACDRPEAWALTEKYIARQTSKYHQWLVLDDDEAKTKCTLGEDYVYCPETRGPGSLTSKIAMAITKGLITGDAIVFIENDDWYHPQWLEFCNAQLGLYNMIGEGRAIYYNVAKRWWYEHQNMGHASLCSTAIDRSIFHALLAACQTSNPFVDARLWRDSVGKKRVFDPFREGGRKVVGIKAMPGRVGYGGGHVVRDVNATNDAQFSKLQDLIYNDSASYVEFYDAPLVSKVPFHTETGRVHGPNWLKWLGHLTDNQEAAGLEIGTFKGESAEWMLENIFTHPQSKYWCVDPFTGNVEHAMAKIDCSALETETRLRLAAYPQAQIVRGYSSEVLRGFKVCLLDFIYVDAAHDSMNVLRDAVIAFDLLKPGGVMVFDDYAWEVLPDALDRPKLAIDAFLSCYAKQIEVLTPRGWQIAIKKK